MRKIVKKEVIQELYDDALLKAQKTYNEKSYKHSISFYKFAGWLAWNFPFLQKFSDNSLEEHISKIGNLFTPIEFIPIKEKIVFYNSQIIDSGALTEQYLDFFITNNLRVLFIIPDIINTVKGEAILKKVNSAPHITLYIASQKSDLEKVEEIRNILMDFKAEKCFLHFVPNDIVGCLSFQNISSIKTYYIVHNDHTFWLGKNYFDYYIEFRNFGITLAVERRRIPKDKILHIPFYPINNKKQFQGFPFKREGKIIGVCAANLYKFYLDPELKYFQIIKELLFENQDFIFCLCGYGNEKPIKEFIIKNQLEERFYFLGGRSDFYNLVGQCDILFESYPMKGALTPLFATEQKVAVVGISSYDNASGSLEELLNITGYKQPEKFEEFQTEAKRLIRDKNYRIWLGNHLSKNHYNKNDFEVSLQKILDNDLDDLKPITILPLKLNDDAYLQEYLNLEESSIGNILKYKLYILKLALSFFSIIKILIPALKASKKDIYRILRRFISKITLG